MSNFSGWLFLRKHMMKVIVIIVSITIFSVAFWVRSSANHELNSEKSNLLQQQVMNNTGSDSALLLARYLNSYKLLQQQGVIGDANRLQWLESVQKNVNYNFIPKLNFILSPTKLTTDANAPYHSPELKTKTTLMQVNFSLLHEGDFYNLLNELRMQSQGVFNVEECSIRRSDEKSEEQVNKKLEAKFTGSCYLRWYSIPDVTQLWEVPAE